MTYYLGVDVGGTNIKFGIANVVTGETFMVQKIQTEASKNKNIVTNSIIKTCQTILKSFPNPVCGIGIGIPGQIKMEDGTIAQLPNFNKDWKGFDITSQIADVLELPVFLINDSRAVTLGEFVFGAGKGFNSGICLTLGTGVGGGVVINRQLLLSRDGNPGEFGHIIVHDKKIKCGCGSYGCLETVASGTSIATAGVKAVKQGLNTGLGEFVDFKLENISAETVYELASGGDSVALDIFSNTAKYLAIGLNNILVTLSPDIVILSGGVANSWEILKSYLLEEIRKRTKVIQLDKIHFTKNELGDRAGIIGTAFWASRMMTYQNEATDYKMVKI